MIYNHKTRTNPSVISFKANHNTSNELPKLVLGLADVHRMYGSLPWKFLVTPAANLARFEIIFNSLSYFIQLTVIVDSDFRCLNH